MDIRKIQIDGTFSNEEVDNKLTFQSTKTIERIKSTTPKHVILPEEPFELVETPNGTLAKLAYNKLYSHTSYILNMT